MDKEDLHRQVAALHAANIDRGFLATLGVPFLVLMYRAIDEAPGNVLLVEECDGRVAGFVSAGAGMGAIYRRMLRHPFRLAWSLLPSLLRPRRLARILEILRYNGTSPTVADLPEAELLSIAVDPVWRGRQVADKLYRRLMAHFRESGIPGFRIVVGDALAPAHRFYAKMGARPVGKIEVHAGESSVVYVQDTAEIASHE